MCARSLLCAHSLTHVGVCITVSLLPASRPLGRAAGVPRPAGPRCGWCGRGDPAPAPQRALLRAGVARSWGGGRASPGGGAFHRRGERLRSGPPPPPTACPPGGLSGSATHVLWAQVCGCGGPALSPRLACPVGAACREGGGGASPGGAACNRCEGRLVSGAVPPPAAHPLGRATGVPRPVCPSKKKGFSNALGYTLVVLEVLHAHRHFYLSIGPTKSGDNTF